MALLWPPVMYFHGLYQIRRGRSLIDETFAILFSVLIASALTLGATLYVRVYYRFQPEVAPLWEYSQAVFALFVVLDVLLVSLGRRALRAWQERQWAAGENLTRVLVAGTGELGHAVAEALLAHRRLGYRVIGFLGEGPDAVGHAGLPVLGTIETAREAVDASQADEVYVALPLEDHARLVPLVQGLSNECVDLKVVPDVVQYATIRASLEDLDGMPIISLNEVPLQGWSSMAKRVMDLAVSSAMLLVLTPVLLVLAPARPAPRRQRPRAAAPGAHDPRRKDVPDLQVPHHGRRGREGDRARSSRPRTIRAARRSAPGCAATTSTSCRSC